MTHIPRWLTTFGVALVIGTGLAAAADLDKATADAEGRKRAAENGARSIRAKAPHDVDAIRAMYGEAAAANGEWLAATSASIEKGDADPAVTEAATRAAASLLRWVAGRNRALGLAVPTDRIAEVEAAKVRQGLIDISTELSRKHRGANAATKAQATSNLANRLKWAAWDAL